MDFRHSHVTFPVNVRRTSVVSKCVVAGDADHAHVNLSPPEWLSRSKHADIVLSTWALSLVFAATVGTAFKIS